MSSKIQYKIYDCAVDPARIPGRAPTMLLLGPWHAGTQGLATNLSEEGYQVVLVDTCPDSSSLSSLRLRSDASDAFIADDDLRDTDGWCMAINLLHLVDEHAGGWNEYTALVTLGLEQRDMDLVMALNVESSKRGGLSAYVAYGPRVDRGQAVESVQLAGDFPVLVHLAESDTELVGALVDAAEHGIIPQDALPFHPELNEFKASLGPVKAKPLSIFTYTSITPEDDVSIWACAFPFSHHTKDFAFPSSSSVQVNEAHRSAAAMSYSRTLSLLKSTMGPRFPLEQLWDQHTFFEFAERDASRTMSTMQSEPYVNHVACLTGGAGYPQLARFYEHHFTTVSPPDTRLVNISRTIGTDRIIDEMVFSCTHTTQIDYFLPGIPPTGKKLRIPMVGIVNLRGDKLAYESLYWDQANALVQLGLVDAEKSSMKEGVRLPVAGDEVAQKILHPYGVPSNELMPNWKDSEGKSGASLGTKVNGGSS